MHAESVGAEYILPLHLYAKYLSAHLDITSRWLEGLPRYRNLLDKAVEIEDGFLEMHSQLGYCAMLLRLGKYKEAEESGVALRSCRMNWEIKVLLRAPSGYWGMLPTIRAGTPRRRGFIRKAWRYVVK